VGFKLHQIFTADSR